MPVRFDEYEASRPAGASDGLDWGVDPDSNAYSKAVLAFLAQDPDLGFSAKEIHEATAIGSGSIRTTLRLLRARDLVRQKGPYWTLHRRGIEAYEELIESVQPVG